ncbi:YitT family protein [Marinoscillum sp. MHG1-6]|uniref:YitT family protein n=1 Tax=Marinoscillum sp. MHG1-6 TaxID=2959627 RepID=UPI002157DE92|nr:YitT family protein [Marinoscillum sp. MHG1-6]
MNNLVFHIRSLSISVKRLSREVFLIVLGVVTASFGLESFLLPNDVLDGGVTGISLLLTVVTGGRLSVFIFLINIPFLVLGLIQIGKAFAIKSLFSVSLLALVIYSFEFPTITSDPLLVAVFGGFFLGLGIGFTIRGGAILDGTEILAIFLGKKTGFSVGELILIFNILIFSVAAYLLSMETALYSIITYFAASRTVDFVLEGFDEYIGVTIVSAKNKEIREMILTKLRRGATVYHGSKGYSLQMQEDAKTHIIYTVITRLEIARLESEIEIIDPEAFLVMSKVKDIKGGMIRKLPLKKLKNKS